MPNLSVAVWSLVLMVFVHGAAAQEGDASAAAGPGDPVVLPTHYEEHRFFVTPVTRDGEQLTFFTDTGGGLFVTAAAVERLNLESMALEDLESQGIVVPAAVVREMPPGARFVQLPEFRPDASIPAPTTPWGEGFLLPFAPVEGSAGKLVRDGMLGQMWFAGRIWVFDYPNRRMLLLAPGAAPAGEGHIPFGFKTAADGRRISSYPRMPMVVDGETIQMLFDTGATTVLSEEALKIVGDGGDATRATSFIAEGVFNDWRQRHPEWRIIEGAETYSGQAMIEARDVTIAGQTIDAVWFTRRTDRDYTWMSGFMDEPIKGALGGNALRHFRITVDYPGAAAVFEFVGGD